MGLLGIIGVIVVIFLLVISFTIYFYAQDFNFKDYPILAVKKAARKIWEDVGNKIIYNINQDPSFTETTKTPIYEVNDNTLTINIEEDCSLIDKINLNDKECSC